MVLVKMLMEIDPLPMRGALVMTWIFVVAFILPWLLHREFGRSAAGQGL